VTITSQPKFLGLIYFLSNGASLAGFARRLRYKERKKENKKIPAESILFINSGAPFLTKFGNLSI